MWKGQGPGVGQKLVGAGRGDPRRLRPTVVRERGRRAQRHGRAGTACCWMGRGVVAVEGQRLGAGQ